MKLRAPVTSVYRLGFSRLFVSSPFENSLLAGYSRKCHSLPIPAREYHQVQQGPYSANDSCRLGFSRRFFSSPCENSLLAGYSRKCHSLPSPARKYQQEQQGGSSANDSSTMPINIILTGATGTAGSAALRQAIADPEVRRITVLTRRPLDTEHEKLRVIIHKDFNNYEDITSQLGDHQAALWCLGISQSQVTKEQYDVITYDYAMAAAKAFGAANPNESFKFLFLSGQGADSSEKSSLTFARVKGKTENALAKLGYPASVSFRPGYIHPDVRTKTSIGTKLTDLLAVPAYKFTPAIIINGADLGKGMLEVAKYGSDKQVLPNSEIQKLANQYSARSSGAET